MKRHHPLKQPYPLPSSTLQTLPHLSTPHNDSLTLQITTQKLNGQKFLQWSQSAKLFIESKERMGYIIGVKLEPNPNDP